MSLLIGSICGYCNKPLGEKDDIVVCPICGTPHHRSCYFEHNACFNEALHSEDFTYTRPMEENAIVCSHCGKTLSSEAEFCNYCGAPIGKQENTKEPTQDAPVFMFGTQLFPAQTTRTDLEEDIDDIKIKYWVTYIGSNANYYLNIFKLQNNSKKKTSFTLSAVLFPFIYFLYRRIWGAAIVSAIVNLFLGFPGFVMMYLAPNGISLGLNLATLDKLSGVFGIVNTLINIAWGVFAVWLFRRRAGTRIKKIKENTTSEVEFSDRLKAKSGASVVATILGVAILTILVAILGVATGLFNVMGF